MKFNPAIEEIVSVMDKIKELYSDSQIDLTGTSYNHEEFNLRVNYTQVLIFKKTTSGLTLFDYTSLKKIPINSLDEVKSQIANVFKRVT